MSAVFLGCLLVLPLGSADYKPAQTAFDPETLQTLRLQETNGNWRNLPLGEKWTVVAFLGTECPLVHLYAPRLKRLAQSFAPQGVRFVGINSNDQDTIEEVHQFVSDHELSFAMLKDPSHQAADLFGASRTPEVFVFDANGKIAYQGRIDDQFAVGTRGASARSNDLEQALEELTTGKVATSPWTEPVGCMIGRRPEKRDQVGKITYSEHIAAMLDNRCVICHREGQVAPFALDNYPDAAAWGETLLEAVEERRMPPWHANPEYGKFFNDCRLSDKEITEFREWVEGGCPEGDLAKRPEPPTWPTGWRIPEPDVVLTMDEAFDVPAEGEVAYKYFVVSTNFTEDKWVQFAECQPGNPAVVHHILVLINDGFFNRKKQKGMLRSQWLAATAPGSPPMWLPSGHAKRIPKGSNLIFQVHYTPNGKKQTDLSRVGLKFLDPDEVEKEVITSHVLERRFAIPPGDDNYVITKDKDVPFDMTLLSMFPHMHLRGKAFRYEAIFPTGEREILLDIPRYDFNWQNGYRLETPRVLPRGTKLVCTATYDNSSGNISNPDPEATVRWGDQTWEEMMIGYVDVVVDRKKK